MDDRGWVVELETLRDAQLGLIAGAGRTSLADGASGEPKTMLQVALANEINVSELAAGWMPSTRELDVKLAFARQSGDEASHFQLVSDRLTALGFDVEAFRMPTASPLFEYLRGLATTVERIAAGLFTLEAIAYSVNENFMAFCQKRGDGETVRLYREYIQPDERAHQLLGRRLVAKYGTTPELQRVARETVGRVLEIATAARSQAAQKMGTACFPGC
jgi:hypothetical protein